MKKLTCHCRAVEIEVNLPDKLEKVVRCNCSLCKRKGFIMTFVGSNDLKIIKGKEHLKLHQFHTKTAKHYFCSNCGIHTHFNPRFDPKLNGINVACVEGIDAFELKNVIIADGKNHILDKKK